MSWFAELEGKRRFALISIILLMVATIGLTSMRDPRSMDGFWHLRMGQDLIENGLSPFQDHYSFTYQGEEVDSPPVAFEVALYYLVKHFGVDGGFKLFKLLSMSLVLVMMLWWLHRIKAPVLVYGLVLPLLVTMLQFRATARPELVAYALLILAIILYERARRGLNTRLSLGNMLPIALLMLAWNNYHSAVYGYIIFFGLFIDLALVQWKEKQGLASWSRWVAWGGLIVVLGFANPSFTHPLIAALTLAPEWKTLIQEYLSPVMYANVPSFYVLILVALFTLILCWKQKLYGYLIVCAVLVANAATTARLVAPAGITVLCIFAYAASHIRYEEILRSGKRLPAVAIPILAMLVMMVPLLHNVYVARAFVAQNADRGYFPHGLVSYMNDNGRAGRILNDYGMGGFLIYHLAPQSQVYIDGRTQILYPVAHYLKLLELFRSPDAMREEIEKYDIDFVVAKDSSDTALLMERTGVLQLDYADLNYFLYSRHGASTPVAGHLWARPYCWEQSDTDALNDERTTAAIQFIPDSPLQQFLQLLTGFGAAEDPSAFLSGQQLDYSWSSASKRFAGYQALKLGEFEIARHYFSRIAQKDATPKDHFALALTALRSGDPAAAESVLATALKRKWHQLEFNDLVILHALLIEVREQQGWKILDDSYIDQLAGQIGEQAIAGTGSQVTVESFCAE